MRRTLAIIVLAAFATTPSFVSANSDSKTETGTLTGKLVTRSGKRFKDSGVVYLQPTEGTKLPKPKKKKNAKIVQKYKKFKPGWIVVTKGTSVAFPNQDTRDHNVFSNSKGNRFDLDVFGPGDSDSAKMRKVGVVDIQCNIHPEMAAAVLVVPNDYYASTKDNGDWTLSNVPAGTYIVKGYVPDKRVPGKRREGSVKVTVEAGKTASVDVPMSKVGKRPKKKKDETLHRFQ